VRRIERFNDVTGPTGIMGIVAMAPPNQMCTIVVSEQLSSKAELDQPRSGLMPHFCPEAAVVPGPTRVQSILSFSLKRSETQALLSFLGVIRQIEIWRVAVLMVNRYADKAEANSFQRAVELRPRTSLGALRRS